MDSIRAAGCEAKGTIEDSDSREHCMTTEIADPLTGIVPAKRETRRIDASIGLLPVKQARVGDESEI